MYQTYHNQNVATIHSSRIEKLKRDSINAKQKVCVQRARYLT